VTAELDTQVRTGPSENLIRLLALAASPLVFSLEWRRARELDTQVRTGPAQENLIRMLALAASLPQRRLAP
jgi:hypothetical protein